MQGSHQVLKALLRRSRHSYSERMNGDKYIHDVRRNLQILHHPNFVSEALSSSVSVLRSHLSLVTYRSAQLPSLIG